MTQTVLSKRDKRNKAEPREARIKKRLFVWLYVDYIDSETDKALKVVLRDGTGHWLAKSQIPNVLWYSAGLCNCVIAIPEWLAEKIGCENKFATDDIPTRQVAFGDDPNFDESAERSEFGGQFWECTDCGRSRRCRRLPFFANIRPRCFKCGGASLVPLGGAPILDQ